MNDLPKLVVSRQLTATDWSGTQVISDDPTSRLARLKEQPGKNIALLGSSTLTAHLLPTGLVDEARIMVMPVILGSGRSLLGAAGRIGLRLISTRVLGSGAVLLRYRPGGVWPGGA